MAKVHTGVAGAPNSDFVLLLREFLERSPHSRNAVAQAAGIDPSYLTRCLGGDRSPPSRPILEALARVLKLSIREQGRLIAAAGYLPLTVEFAGGWDDVFDSVAAVLSDGDMTPYDVAEFKAVIRAICSRYLGSRVPIMMIEENGHVAMPV